MWDGKALARGIQAARKAQGLTQEQLGAQVGVSGQAVSKWETGESSPEVALLPDICAALGVSADALLGTGENAGLDTLLRRVRERLDAVPVDARAGRLAVILGTLLSESGHDPAGVETWAGHDVLTAGRRRGGAFHGATLVTSHGSVVHVRDVADLAAADVADGAIVAGLAALADVDAIRVLRRLVPDGAEGAALGAEARQDEGTRAVCDRLVAAGYLELTREGYGLTGNGLLIAATILLLAEVPGLAGEPRRLRWMNQYHG